MNDSESPSLKVIQSWTTRDQVTRLDLVLGWPDLNPWLVRWYVLLWHPRWLWRRLTQPKPWADAR